MKGKVKRILSGMLSVITIMTSIIQPITIYAVETEPAAYEAKYGKHRAATVKNGIDLRQKRN